MEKNRIDIFNVGNLGKVGSTVGLDPRFVFAYGFVTFGLHVAREVAMETVAALVAVVAVVVAIVTVVAIVAILRRTLVAIVVITIVAIVSVLAVAVVVGRTGRTNGVIWLVIFVDLGHICSC